MKHDYLNPTTVGFHAQQAKIISKSTTNKTLWGILQDDLDALNDRQTEYEPLYVAASDKETRSRKDVAAFKPVEKAFRKEIRNFCQTYLIHNPKVSVADKTEMGLTIPDTEPSPGGPILDTPYIKLQAIGGGELEARCKTTTDASKCSIPKNAKVVDYRYALLESGELAPANPEDCPHSGSSRSAKFVIKTGAQNSGKKFCGYFRWLNDTRARQEGPWTLVINAVVV